MLIKNCNVVEESSKLFPVRLTKSSRIKNKVNINRDDYTKIVNRFLFNFMEDMILTGDKYKLPAYLGYLQVVKYRHKNQKKSIDKYQTQILYGEYNKDKPYKEKKHVYHDKTLTNGYNVRIHWHKENIPMFKNRHCWSFQIARQWYRPMKNDSVVRPVTLWNYFKDQGHKLYKTMGFKYEVED